MNIFTRRNLRRLEQQMAAELAAEVAGSVGLADTSDLALMRHTTARFAATGARRTAGVAMHQQTPQPERSTQVQRRPESAPRQRPADNKVVPIRRNPPPPPPVAARPAWLTQSA